MDLNWAPYENDSQRDVRVLVYASATPRDVLLGIGLGAFDLTPYVSSCKQSANEVYVQLAWHTEIYGATQPAPGNLLEIKLEDKSYWIGMIQSINDYRLETGVKMMTVIARSRDATPAWREARRVTDVYGVSTTINHIVTQIAYGLGLSDEEIALPNIPLQVVHSNIQLADLPPWQMLEVTMRPAGFEPGVNARGQLRAINRDTRRPADIVLDNERLISVTGSKDKPAVSEVQIKWLDPKLWEVAQQDQKLDQATITAGFFQLRQTKDVQFGADGTQRARDTRLVIKQSANSGLLPVCDEDYRQRSDTRGKITLETTFWVPTLATVCMLQKYLTHITPDTLEAEGPVVKGWAYVGMGTLLFGRTIPIGREKQYWADALLLLTMMSIGTGVYEIWGTPYDYVHARNSTTAYNPRAKPWETNVMEIENDFVMDESGAQAFAIRELVRSAHEASSYNVRIVDDPRIERGDILELNDGSRLYVTDYSRDLTQGAAAVLDIQGFRC